MTDLFGEPTPIRVVLHFNLYAQRTLLDYDLMAMNPQTGDLLAMYATVQRPAHKLGPTIAHVLLDVHTVLTGGELDHQRE
jgi:hypothetical protein